MAQKAAGQVCLAGCQLIAPSGAGRGQNAHEKPHLSNVADRMYLRVTCFRGACGGFW